MDNSNVAFRHDVHYMFSHISRTYLYIHWSYADLGNATLRRSSMADTLLGSFICTSSRVIERETAVRYCCKWCILNVLLFVKNIVLCYKCDDRPLYISLYLGAVMLRVGRSIAGGHSSGCGCLGDHGSL